MITCSAAVLKDSHEIDMLYIMCSAIIYGARERTEALLTQARQGADQMAKTAAANTQTIRKDTETLLRLVAQERQALLGQLAKAAGFGQTGGTILGHAAELARPQLPEPRIDLPGISPVDPAATATATATAAGTADGKADKAGGLKDKVEDKKDALKDKFEEKKDKFGLKEKVEDKKEELKDKVEGKKDELMDKVEAKKDEVVGKIEEKKDEVEGKLDKFGVKGKIEGKKAELEAKLDAKLDEDKPTPKAETPEKEKDDGSLDDLKSQFQKFKPATPKISIQISKDGAKIDTGDDIFGDSATSSAGGQATSARAAGPAPGAKSAKAAGPKAVDTGDDDSGIPGLLDIGDDLAQSSGVGFLDHPDPASFLTRPQASPQFPALSGQPVPKIPGQTLLGR
jgi:hypothetical protein